MTTVPTPMGPELPGTKQVVLGVPIERWGDVSQRTYRLDVQIAFLPCGLLLWGATEDTVIRRIQVGNQLEGVANCGGIPGLYFSHGHTFEQIVAMAECNELDLNVLARQQLQMEPAFPGVLLTLELEGPCDQACFWGRTFTRGRPYERATIERAGTGEYRGRLDQIGLQGIDTVLDVVAPTPEATAALLTGLGSRGRYGV